MTLQVEIRELRRMLKEKCEEIISDKKLADVFYMRICEIEDDERFAVVDDIQGEKGREAGMIDRKQVIHDIERCTCRVRDACRDCSKHKEDQPAVICMEELLTDVLKVLREQEPISPSVCSSEEPDGHGSWWYQCGKCKMPIDYGDRFCRQCGKEVKWKRVC